MNDPVASLCARTYLDTAGEAVWEATLTGKAISDLTLQSLTQIGGPYALGCVTSFTRNGYEIGYGSRARICNDFRMWNAVSALDSLTRRGGAVDDTTLMQLSRY